MSIKTLFCCECLVLVLVELFPLHSTEQSLNELSAALLNKMYLFVKRLDSQPRRVDG